MTSTDFDILPTTYDGDDFEHCYECDEELDGPGFMVIRNNGRSAALTHHCSKECVDEYVENPA